MLSEKNIEFSKVRRSSATAEMVRDADDIDFSVD